MIKIIKIVDNPKFIIVTKHGKNYYHYFMAKLDTLNKYGDIGVWKIKYKKKR